MSEAERVQELERLVLLLLPATIREQVAQLVHAGDLEAALQIVRQYAAAMPPIERNDNG